MAEADCIQNPVYQSMYEPVETNQPPETGETTLKLPNINEAELGEVKKRNKRSPQKNIRQRLSNVVSWYVPNNAVTDEGKLLINIPEDHDEAKESDGESEALPFSVKHIHNLKKLLDCVPVDFLENKDVSSLTISCACVLNRHIYLGFNAHASLLRVSLDEETTVLTVQPVYLRVNKHPLYPIQIQAGCNDLYVSGYYNQEMFQKNVESERQHFILVKFDGDGTCLARTKSYPFPYFGSFTVDNDGALIVACPQMSADSLSAKVFKLSANFDRKSYFIKLSNQRYVYRPDWVTSHSANQRGWISVNVQCQPKYDQENDEVIKPSEEETEAAEAATVSRRLLSFPCCRPADLPQDVETKKWLTVDSWNFEGVVPGYITSIGSRLLIIDDVFGNIHFLEWDNEQDKPVLKPISKKGTARFIGVASYEEQLFLYTASDIFLFKFKD